MLSKTYLRYSPHIITGLISSPGSNSILLHLGGTRLACTAILENIAVWNLKQNTMIHLLSAEPSTDCKPEVTCLASQMARDSAASNEQVFAAGYADGSICIFDAIKGERILTLRGHSSAISSLYYSASGSLLISGSRDTDIVIWDVIGEQGLFRLHGHKDEITSVRFLKDDSLIVSSSKDSFLKVWDLETRHCIQTIANHHTQIWSFDVNLDQTRLITGAADSELRIYIIDLENENEPLTFFGSIPRSSKQRVQTIFYSPDQSLLAVQCAGKVIEFFSVRNEEQVHARIARRKRRAREKGKDVSDESAPSDELASLPALRLHTHSKIRSFAFHNHLSSTVTKLQFLVAFQNNALALYQADSKNLESSITELYRVENHGHRAGIRALAVSSDDSMVASVCSSQVKIWNTHSGNCIRSATSGFGLNVVFVPGDRQVLISTKQGELQLFDVASSDCLQSVVAHSGSIWSLCLRPDQRGFATGGADKEIKFWNFELVKPKESQSIPKLSFRQFNSLTLLEDILSLVYSPNGKFIAASLLDSTISVFFTDSHKLFLSLYGHKLPALSVDISSDNTLLVSGSADKNIKVWGLDFGDCHKSFFAHTDSVTCVKFVRDTHYFFSAGKDHLIKYWDADKQHQILSIPGHQAELWSCAVSSVGDYVVSAGNDLSIRFWKQTDDIVYLEEEKDNEMNRMFEKDILTGAKAKPPGAIEGSNLPGQPESTKPTQVSLPSISDGEKLIDFLDIAYTEEQRWAQYESFLQKNQESSESFARFGVDAPPNLAPPSKNPLLCNKTPQIFIFDALSNIPSAHLEDALMVMPFDYVIKLLHYLCIYIEKGWRVELAVRCALFLLSIYTNQLIISSEASAMLNRLSELIIPKLHDLKDVISFNQAASGYLLRDISSSNAIFYSDREAISTKKRKLE